MYKKKLWKPIIAGTLALAMALTPLGNASIVSAAESTETSNKVNAELTTTDDVTDVTTEDNTEAVTESDSADSSSSTECSEDTTEDMDAESTDAVDETATEESEKAEIPESIQEEESGINTAENIPLTAAYFPDANFRKYISENVDTNKDNVLSQAERDACTAIVFDSTTGYEAVSTFEGIQYFSKLNKFYYGRYEYAPGKDRDSINKIDLSKNIELTDITINDTCIETLDLKTNKKLVYLDCMFNSITNLDISANAILKELLCDSNNLRSIDTSNNPELTRFWCSDNLISKIDISKNTKLTSLLVSVNPLEKIDASNNPQLKSITGCSCNITSLDISKCTKLENLNINCNKLKYLDVSKCIELKELYCGGNQLAYIDTSNNKQITWNKFSASNNVYPVKFNSKKRFDLSSIPGFQVSRVSDLQGGTISGTILTLDNGSDKVTYTYNCDNHEVTPSKESNNSSYTQASGSCSFTIENSDKRDYFLYEAFVVRLYTICLGRTAEQSGIDYWSFQLFSGRITGAQIGYNFVFSDEYKKKNTSDEAYVKMLYKVFMDREADQGGLNYWLDLLNQGMSREYVYKGFAESQEFTKICTSYGIERGTVKLTQARDQNVNLTKFVNRIYVKAMNRKGDENGLNYWCNQILTKKMTPVQVAESFIYSKEFTDKNLSNTEYIKVLYRTFMGREADSAGLNYWLGRLNKGESRKTVLKAFAGCQEFKNIVKSFGL